MGISLSFLESDRDGRLLECNSTHSEVLQLLRNHLQPSTYGQRNSSARIQAQGLRHSFDSCSLELFKRLVITASSKTLACHFETSFQDTLDQ